MNDSPTANSIHQNRPVPLGKARSTHRDYGHNARSNAYCASTKVITEEGGQLVSGALAISHREE